VGFQVIEPFAANLPTMGHVAQMGTYVHPDHRRQGVGRLLAKQTMTFAAQQGFEKIVIYVLAQNTAGLGYYRRLGFERRGLLKGQTKLDGVYHDEVVMELMLKEERP
jgi:ribosomal protein S18 acetylase RimI-like enzyme